MLVEDDNNLREIYEARLLAEGYQIVSARDGEEALAMAVKEKPDLIISDVMMPKISGFDMLDILRSTPETRNTKVIMMTALSQAEDKARAGQLGADRYLVKSQVTLEDVARATREVLDGEGTGPGGGQFAAPPADNSTPATEAPVAYTASTPVANSAITDNSPSVSTNDLPGGLPGPGNSQASAANAGPALAVTPASSNAAPAAIGLAGPPAPASSPPAGDPATAATAEAWQPGPSIPSIVGPSAAASGASTFKNAQTNSTVVSDVRTGTDTKAAAAASQDAAALPQPNADISASTAAAPPVALTDLEPSNSAAEAALIDEQIQGFLQAEIKTSTSGTDTPSIVNRNDSPPTVSQIERLNGNDASPSRAGASANRMAEIANQALAAADSQTVSSNPARTGEGGRKVIQPPAGDKTGAPQLSDLMAREDDVNGSAPLPASTFIDPGGKAVTPVDGAGQADGDRPGNVIQPAESGGDPSELAL